MDHLVGGFVDQHEPLEKAAARELEEETGLTGMEIVVVVVVHFENFCSVLWH